MEGIILISILILNLIIVFLFVLSLKTHFNILSRLGFLEKNNENIQNTIRQESAVSRQEFSKNAKDSREELANSMKVLSETLENKLGSMRLTVENQLKNIQEDNSKKLEQMRATVDEKLHATLEQRLGESFKQVSDKLESVYRGLGEMQALASNVGDLKNMLTNVKTRGTWGEIQLGALLEQILSKEQYEENVVTKQGSNERVEFAIKLPGKDYKNTQVWLPIDAKFPHEDYNRLVEAEQSGNVEDMEKASKQLETRIKNEAKSISNKYLDPPNTTDFAIMFLATEGLYAEVLRKQDLVEHIQRKFRVIVSGPTTLTALLNSLQMGFRTLAIEKRSSEIWDLLGTIKNDFRKFGHVLSKTKKKLKEASNTIEDAERRSRAIERHLRDVQDIPYSDEIEDTEEKMVETVIKKD